MHEPLVPLLDRAGQWTHRDRHRHNGFEVQVPAQTVELRVRLRWEPLVLASVPGENLVWLALFDPAGFRGAALRTCDDLEITIGESTATPGCLAGPIAAGAWTLNVDTGEILNDGADTGFLTYHLEATARIGDPGSAGVTAAPVGAAPAPPAGGARWYRGDLHSHTVHSDGDITVEARARGAVERGLDFLAITDHNTVSQHREIARWPDGITPIRGSEITTFHGHINCLGVERAIDWRDDARDGGAAAIVEAAHRQHALVSINHPSAFGDPWCSGCHWDFVQVDYATFDAIEVWNGRWAISETHNQGALEFWTDLLDAGLRLTGVAGTDSHSADEDRYVALPMTYVHAHDSSEAAIIDGIRVGRVVLSSGPLLSFLAVGSDGVGVDLPGAELPADGALLLSARVERLETRATLWFATRGTRIPLTEVDPAPERVIDARRLVASVWWRLELRAGPATNGDLLALTNPVFVAAG